MATGTEVPVSLPTPAPGQKHPLWFRVFGKIVKDLSSLFFLDQSSGWYCDHDRLAIFPKATLALTRLSVLGVKGAAHSQVCQGFQIFFHLKDNITAATSVAPIRAAERNILFTPKGNRSRPTVTGRDFDDGLVNEAFQLTRLFRNGDDCDGFLAAALEEAHHSGYQGK